MRTDDEKANAQIEGNLVSMRKSGKGNSKVLRRAKVKPKKNGSRTKTKIRHQIKTPSGQMITTPWQGSVPSLSATGNANDSSLGVGTTMLLNGAAAAAELRKLLLDPWSDNPIGRWPDAYTMIPTFVSKDVYHSPMTIYNGTTAADGCAAMYVRGDSYKTHRQPSSIDTPLNLFEVKWNSASDDMMAAIPVGAMVRPVGAGYRFTFSGVGPYHTIVARIIELPPWAYIAPADHPLNFPVGCNTGPTFAQREFMRGREVVMAPGETLNLIMLPGGMPGLNFTLRGYDRDITGGSIYGAAWSGFVVWFFGLSSNDTLYCDGMMHHEYYLPSAATLPATSNNSRAIVKPDIEAVQNVDSELVDLASYGWNVFKTTVSTAINIFSALTPLFSGNRPVGLTAVPALSKTVGPASPLCFAVSSDGALLPNLGHAHLVTHPAARCEVKDPEIKEAKPLMVASTSSLKSSSASSAEEFEDLSKSCLLKELKKRL